MSTLDKNLDLWANHEPRESTVASAQKSLERVLASGVGLHRRRARRIGGWALAAIAGVAVVSLPLVLTSKSAFARAQKHLGEFRTLGFDVEFMSGDVLLMRGHVVMTPAGDYRHQWGDILSVRNQSLGRNVVLFSVPRMYLEQDINEKNVVDQWIELIAGLQRFDGKAVKLPELRTIRGLAATGWTLKVRDKPATLWASEEGVPLELDVQETELGRVHYRFEYNPPVSGDTFDTSIPDGYRTAEPEKAECEKTGKPIWTSVNTAEYTDSATGEKKSRKYRIRFDCKRQAAG